jgi:hypothetical protein
MVSMRGEVRKRGRGRLMMTLLIPRLEKAPKPCGAYFLLDLDSSFNNVETAEGNDCILFDFLSNSGYFVSMVLFLIFGATLHVGHLAPMEAGAYQMSLLDVITR